MIFSCSHGHVLTVDPARAGQQVRCPLCQEVLAAPPSAPPPPVAILVGPPSLFATPPPLALPLTGIQALEITEVLPEESATASPPPYSFAADDGKASRGASVEKEPATDFGAQQQLHMQLRTIQLGLGLHYWKYICMTLSILLCLTSAIAGSMIPAADLVLVCLSFAAGIAGPILGVVGSILCNVRIMPGNSRTLVLISMGMDLASLVTAFLAIIAMVLTIKSDWFVLGLGLLGVSGILNLVAFSLFMLFAKQLACYLGDTGLAQRAQDVMVHFLIATVGGFFGIIILIMFLAALFYITGAPPAFAVFAFYPADIAWIVLVSNSLFQILHAIADLRKRLAEMSRTYRSERAAMLP